jgi:serine/threonine protein kinase/tetratricopeptide (TPR) repeat protein
VSEELDQTHDAGAGSRDSLAPGAQIGKYKLGRVLGSGGMGVVWSAHDPDLERDVAIKVLRRADAGPTLRARLLREARAMARLKHPNVLTVYEVGSDGDRDYIAMELVEGASMDAWLATTPPGEDVWRAMLAAGRGLAAAHDCGLVHRDFKPHNVMRSHDGRVLVTDFGLARGQGDEMKHGPPVATPVDALDVTVTPQRTDSVLSSTLTEPGSVLGTPAYMAPEQFEGAPPDPRTDQFAYCVTAWQALSGERPFAGNNIDELRRATKRGVAKVTAKLPRGVRPVLTRGLAVDPAARWPDMHALLAALERTEKRRLWRSAIVWSVVGTIIVFSALGGIQWLLASRSTPEPKRSPLACTPADEVFAEVWSPMRRTALEQRVPHNATVTGIADALDELQKSWLARYATACDAPPGPTAYARLGCLLGERDELASFTRFADTLPASKFDGIDLWGILPRVEACDGDSPVAPPLMPADRKLRDRVVALRARVTSLRVGPPEEFSKHTAELVAIAREIGWQPIEAEIDEAAGATAQLQGYFDEARDLFEHAARLAEQLHDYKIEATARISLLEVEASKSADPTDPGRATRLVSEARAAVRRAGDDPVLALSIEEIAAEIAAGTGDADKAIAALENARNRLLGLRAFRQAAAAAAREADLLAERGDVATAWQRALATEQAIASPQRAIREGPLARALIELAWRRGDLADLHARADKLRTPLVPLGSVQMSGHVVGPDGAPVAGARVVVWIGRLVGDASRAYVRGDFLGDVATTDASGAFTINAPQGGGIVAEHDTLRSAPRTVPKDGKPLELVLAPTRALAGTVSPPHARDVHVRFDVNEDATWSVATALASDGSYKLENVPAGGTLLATDRKHTLYAGAPRDGVAITWPTGPKLDIVMSLRESGVKVDVHRESPAARRARESGTMMPSIVDLWLLRGREHAKTSAQLEARRGDVVRVHPEPLGLATVTSAGLPHYTREGWHAVIADVPPGDVTICTVFASEEPTCSNATVTAQPAVQAVVLP